MSDDAFYTLLVAKNNSVEPHHGRPGRKPARRQRIRASMAITFWNSRFLRDWSQLLAAATRWGSAKFPVAAAQVIEAKRRHQAQDQVHLCREV